MQSVNPAISPVCNLRRSDAGSAIDLSWRGRHASHTVYLRHLGAVPGSGHCRDRATGPRGRAEARAAQANRGEAASDPEGQSDAARDAGTTGCGGAIEGEATTETGGHRIEYQSADEAGKA